ncbi:Uncharacterized protein PBTT_09624 [Plasmodiophora brassicae]
MHDQARQAVPFSDEVVCLDLHYCNNKNVSHDAQWSVRPDANCRSVRVEFTRGDGGFDQERLRDTIYFLLQLDRSAKFHLRRVPDSALPGDVGGYTVLAPKMRSGTYVVVLERKHYVTSRPDVLFTHCALLVPPSKTAESVEAVKVLAANFVADVVQPAETTPGAMWSRASYRERYEKRLLEVRQQIGDHHPAHCAPFVRHAPVSHQVSRASMVLIQQGRLHYLRMDIVVDSNVRPARVGTLRQTRIRVTIDGSRLTNLNEIESNEQNEAKTVTVKRDNSWNLGADVGADLSAGLHLEMGRREEIEQEVADWTTEFSQEGARLTFTMRERQPTFQVDQRNPLSETGLSKRFTITMLCAEGHCNDHFVPQLLPITVETWCRHSWNAFGIVPRHRHYVVASCHCLDVELQCYPRAAPFETEFERSERDVRIKHHHNNRDARPRHFKFESVK